MRRYAIGSLPRRVALFAAALVTLGATSAGLTVPDHGVGTNVVDRELEGRSGTFDEGTQVWFWTRVVGAEAGDGIRHVWLRGGEERLTVELDVEGSPWRTYSSKTMHPGSVGSWTVEALDREGRVLARQTFECVPRPAAPAGSEGDGEG